MSDRNERSARLSRRFGDEEEADDGSSDESKTDATGESQLSKTDKTGEAEKSGETSVKDRPSVLMYLPEDLHAELDIRFDELNAQYKREHGEPLEKNRDYYPAIIKAGLEDKDLEDVLDI